MDLSIVITHHRDIGLLKQCLRALLKETKNIDSEIIIVLSEYQRETLDNLKQEFPTIKIFPFKKNLYFIRSANRGLEQAKGEFILIINDDVVVSGGSIKTLVDLLKNNQEIGLVGPKIIYPDGSDQPSRFRFYNPLTIVFRRTILGKTRWGKKAVDKFLYKDRDFTAGDKFDVDWILNGAGALARKEYLKKVGLLDERFKHYFSDVDWCRRFWQNGLKVVYFPKVVFIHHHGRKSQGGGMLDILTNRMTRIHIWDGMKYFLKWGIRDANMRMRTNDTNIAV